jgi:leader peptidase (prepilin peptidase)/N-methyltransferase
VDGLAVAAMLGWAVSVSLLALIDAGKFVLPTPILRAAIVTTGGGLVAAGALSGQWQRPLSAAAAVIVAAVVYGTWSLVSPVAIGFGDVRMACLVALGVGARSLPVALVVLAWAPLAAALMGKYWRPARTPPGRTMPEGGIPIPLGPFLACAGILGVVALAI